MAERPALENTMKGADGLRTLACLMVVFHHLSQQLTFNPGIEAPAWIRSIAEFFTSSGSAGVSVFFVLSGFLLAVPFWRSYFEGKPMPSLRVYAARRAGRIMPGFYLNLLVFFVLAALFTPEAPALLWRYFAGLTFTSGFHWVTFFPAEGNGPLWSIGFEAVSYVLLPIGMLGLFALFGKKRSAAAALGWWVAVWLAVLAAHQGILALLPVEDLGKGWQTGLIGGAKFWMPRYNPIGFFGHFSLGTMAAGLAVLWSRSPRLRSLWFDAASLALSAAWVFILVSRTNQDQFSWTVGGQPYYFPLFAGVTALLLACLTQSRWMARIFDNPFTSYTARISFGLYLWHTFVISGFNGALGDTFEWLLLVIVTLAGSYAVATLSWKYYEEPILRRVQRWKPGLKDRHGMTAVLAAAVLLVAVPLLVSAARPSVWNLPSTSGAVFAFNQPGAVTGLADDGQGGWFAAFNGGEVFHVAADKTYRRIWRLPQDSAELRLTYDRPKNEPLAIPTPGLIVLKTENPFVWNLRKGPDGNVYVAAGDRVVVLSPEGAELKTYAFPRQGDFGVMDVAFDEQGRLYVPDGPEVFRVEDGERSVFLQAASFTKAAGIVIADGTLWIADFDHLHPETGRLLAFPLKSAQPGPPVIHPAPGALFGTNRGSQVSFSQGFTSWIYHWNGSLTQRWYPNLRSLGPLTARGSTLFTGGWDGSIGETEHQP